MSNTAELIHLATIADDEDEALWTASDLAKYLRVSRSWVYYQVESGELPCVRLGSLIRFRPSVIRSLVKEGIPSASRTRSFTRKQ